jgi:hypothetical protein
MILLMVVSMWTAMMQGEPYDVEVPGGEDRGEKEEGLDGDHGDEANDEDEEDENEEASSVSDGFVSFLLNTWELTVPNRRLYLG